MTEDLDESSDLPTWKGRPSVDIDAILDEDLGRPVIEDLRRRFFGDAETRLAALEGVVEAAEWCLKHSYMEPDWECGFPEPCSHCQAKALLKRRVEHLRRIEQKSKRAP